MQLTQGLRRNQLLYPDRVATIFGARETSWSQLADRVARLAGGLRAKGAKPGDRIAILALNSDRYVELYYAIAWAGCVSVPCNTRWAAAEIDHAITDSEPVMAFVDSHFASHGQALAERGMQVMGMDAPICGGSIDELVSTGGAIADHCGFGSDLAGVFYTGGTTGQSKGVMLSHANLLTNFLLLHAVAPYEPETSFLHTPPMFHLADAIHLFGLTMLGAKHVILPGFEAAAAIDAIERHRITGLVLVPTMIGMLCEALRQKPADMSSVRRLTYGASPISSALLERALVALPNATFCQAYGQTELSPCVTVLDHEAHLAGLLNSAGQPLPTVDVRIVDEAMRDLPRGEVGEIIAKGPCTMLGYWRQPELTAATLVDGWIRTGDAGYLNAEGHLFLVDRVKDMIVSGGENIYSAEVENALLRHPDVLQCAVIGVPHPRWGEAVHAVLQVREGSSVTEADLAAHCEPLISNYKRPKSYDLRNQSLPLSGVGKILKTELRRPFWEGQSRSIG